MELIQILLIIIAGCVLFGLYTVKDRSNFMNRVGYKCPNCSSNTWLGEDKCYSCNECGWCIDPYGNGSCAKGNEYGPLYKQCKTWKYKGDCMWGPDCGSNGPMYVGEYDTDPYPWYKRWFWPNYRYDYYNDYHNDSYPWYKRWFWPKYDSYDDDDDNNTYINNNYNYHLDKYNKKNKLRRKIRRLKRKNRRLIKKHEIQNLIKPNKPKPIVIKPRNNTQMGGGRPNTTRVLNRRRERAMSRPRRQSRGPRRQSRGPRRHSRGPRRQSRGSSRGPRRQSRGSSRGGK